MRRGVPALAVTERQRGSPLISKASLQQRCAEVKSHRCANPFQGQQVEDLFTYGGVQAELLGGFDQKLPIGLAMLDHDGPKWAALRCLHDQAQVGDQFPCYVSHTHLGEGANMLPLAQPMQHIVSAHANLVLAGRTIRHLNRRHLSLKERRSGVLDTRPGVTCRGTPVSRDRVSRSDRGTPVHIGREPRDVAARAPGSNSARHRGRGLGQPRAPRLGTKQDDPYCSPDLSLGRRSLPIACHSCQRATEVGGTRKTIPVGKCRG